MNGPTSIGWHRTDLRVRDAHVDSHFAFDSLPWFCRTVCLMIANSASSCAVMSG